MRAEQSGKGPGSRGQPGGCSAHYSLRVNQSHGEVETQRVRTRLSWNCSPLGKTTRVPQHYESAAPAATKTAKMNVWEKLLCSSDDTILHQRMCEIPRGELRANRYTSA